MQKCLSESYKVYWLKSSEVVSVNWAKEDEDDGENESVDTADTWLVEKA